MWYQQYNPFGNEIASGIIDFFAHSFIFVEFNHL